MSYLIPKNELTFTDMRNFREAAVEALIKRAQLKLGATRESLVVRAAQNIADFGTALDQWNTAALAVAGTLYTVFQAVAAPALANNKVVIFYKVGVETAPIPVSLLWLQEGAGAGTTHAVFDLEQLVNGLETEGYFSEPVVYDPQDVMNIRVTARIATGLLARVQLGALIAEPRGQTIS